MRISVIILNWNRPEDTILAVESVLKQDHTDYEVLVWDNASADDSREKLERRFAAESRVRLMFGDANYGVAGGRNRAFKAATGDVFFSLDSDAVLDQTDALRRVASRLAEDASIGALSFEVIRPDGHLMWPFSRPAATWREREFETIRVDGCAFAVPRDVFEAIGGFAEHFSPYGAEDQYFAYQVIGLGRRVVYMPVVRVVHAFSPRGRQGLQFAMHVRNLLWTPLELFPFPRSLLSAGNLARSLWRDAAEQSQRHFFFKGLADAVRGYRTTRRHPLSQDRWRHVRRLVEEDKREGAAS